MPQSPGRMFLENIWEVIFITSSRVTGVMGNQVAAGANTQGGEGAGRASGIKLMGQEQHGFPGDGHL